MMELWNRYKWGRERERERERERVGVSVRTVGRALGNTERSIKSIRVNERCGGRDKEKSETRERLGVRENNETRKLERKWSVCVCEGVDERERQRQRQRGTERGDNYRVKEEYIIFLKRCKF